MTLYEMLDRAMAYQEVWIFEYNAYDQNMPLFKGKVNDARIDPELRVWDFLMCEVEFFDCSHGILDIRVRDKNYDSRLEDHYHFADKWDRYYKSTRPWRFSIEISEEKENAYWAKGVTGK